jgi:metal-responsive CopG/Arc/MetJ family transcriptional regulator
MVRTQIYLTQKERDELAALAESTGKKQSELIRDAVDQLIERSSKARRHAALEAVCGIWKDRTDLPDFEEIRRSWDRDLG